ncbi:MAG TPA: saccharopine dehydrogenase C-terminal domain-containing protein, partial [Bacteroidia bacterium]|nr:saccharopine dehydrogenase C-terminal domain-containing protein [Bacteroidia bacterium]
DDTWKIHDSEGMTYSQLLNSFLPGKGDLKTRLAAFMRMEKTDEAIGKIEWSGILSDEKIKLKDASPAQILQELLERKWKLGEHDKDMIVMQHEFGYTIDGKQKKLFSSLVVKGEDQVHTAMAKTVGLPAAIAVKNILLGKIKKTGVCAPVVKEIYEPVLNELRSFGIIFSEREDQ